MTDAPAAQVSELPRARGLIRASIACAGGRSSLADLHEAGGFRLKFPRPADIATPEAVLVNTGGGMTGGDRLDIELEVEPAARLTFTTQSAEKLYRSNGPDTHVRARLLVGDAGRLLWAPQETILFDGARLDRSLTIDLAPSAVATVIESFAFGRAASGERIGHGALRDVWCVRRAGRLIFADILKLSGDITVQLDRPAIGNGARACLTALHLAPDAPARLDDLRDALATAPGCWGASVLDGLIVVRALAGDMADIRTGAAILMRVFQAGAPSRFW